jgi:hypothetical protein
LALLFISGGIITFISKNAIGDVVCFVDVLLELVIGKRGVVLSFMVERDMFAMEGISSSAESKERENSL